MLPMMPGKGLQAGIGKILEKRTILLMLNAGLFPIVMAEM
jgi:hypothetical protein